MLKILVRFYKKIVLEIKYQIFKLVLGKNFRINSLIIGSQRCGTSFMIKFLSKNSSQIVTPKNEEQLFFFNEKYDPSKNFKKYHIQFCYNFFKKKNIFSKKVFVEKTPEYCLKLSYLKRIHNYNNDIKIIFIFREPHERIISQYQLFKNLGYKESFSNFLKNDDEKTNIKYYSKYSDIQYKINKLFKRKNVLYINFKDLNNLSLINKISKFLEIKFNKLPTKNKKENSFSKKFPSSLNYKSIINNIYKNELKKDFQKFLKSYK